jgi:hypothetical protein
MGISQILDAGPCAIVWDVGGTPVNFRTNFEEVTFKAEQQTIDIFEAQHGDTPVDKVTMGELVTFEANLTRVSLDDLVRVTIGGTLTGSTTKQITFTNPVGDHLYQYAKKVQIKPIINNAISTTSSEWIEIFKVIPVRAFEIPFGKTQRVWHTIFHAFPDQTSGNEGNVYQIGDAT